MARHNWEQIKKEYVEGIEKDGQLVYPSLRDVAEKYSIDISTVGRRASKEQWQTQREIFANKITTERQQKKADIISDEGSQFDLDCFNVAKDGIERINKIISNQFAPEDISKLSAALKNFQAVGKAALGDRANVDNELKIRVSIRDADN